MVPEAGLEPARYFYRGILSPLCLPIPPLGQVNRYRYESIILLNFKMSLLILEAEAGIEPA